MRIYTHLLRRAGLAPDGRAGGPVPGGTRGTAPRWTLGEIATLSLAGILLLVGLLLVATGGPRSATPLAGIKATVAGQKTGQPNPVGPGQALQFVIAFTTDATATGFTVSDPLPAQVDFTNVAVHNIAGLSCALQGNIVQCQNGTLTPAQPGDVTIDTIVHADASGTIHNAASYVWDGGAQQVATADVVVLPPTATPLPSATPLPLTNTPVPPLTNTPVPPTDTPALPTDTPAALTATPLPVTPSPGAPSNTPTPPPAFTSTPAPAATNTPVPAPTDTSVPAATNTPVPAPTNTRGPRPPRPTPENRTPGPAACGDIAGGVILHGAPAAGVTVELRQKANNGADTLLATTKTDNFGVYHFAGAAPAPADAVYYIRYPGGNNGAVAVWYGPGFPYAACGTPVLGTIDITDTPFIGGCNAGPTTLPAAITWQQRNPTDVFRLYFYAGPTMVLDSGELGATAGYTIPAGKLPAGSYSAVLTIRSPLGGNGQSAATCVLTIAGPGPAATAPPAPPPPPPTATATTGTKSVSTPVPATVGPAGLPDVRLSMAVDVTTANPGQTLVYTLLLANEGPGPATNVTLTDQLADGLLLDPTNSITTRGLLKPDGNTARVFIDTLAAGERVTVTLRATVIGAAGMTIANSATVVYDRKPGPVQSNTVETQIVGFTAPKTTATTAPTNGQTQSRAVTPAPTPKPQPTATPRPAASTQSVGRIPQTGGEFPLVTGLLLLVAALLLRWMRLRRQPAPERP